MQTDVARRVNAGDKQAYEKAIQQLVEDKIEGTVSRSPIYRRNGDPQQRAVKDAAKALASLWRASS